MSPALVSKDDYLETPSWVIDDIKSETGITEFLDGCANFYNRKFDNYIPDDKYGGALNEEIPESQWWFHDLPVFINPPRSKNGKFVTKIMNMKKEYPDMTFVVMLCWNDLGNKYCDELRDGIIRGKYFIRNLGKIKFYKNGIETEFSSRLSYFWIRI